MATLLDCIRRVPSIADKIVGNKKEMFSQLFETLGDKLSQMDEIIFIGSGTSNTASVTARYFAERASGLRTSVLLPNEYLYDLSVHNPNALYVFISQTGTSIVVRDCLLHAKSKGYATAAISESKDTPIAMEADIFIDMGCGHEEHPTRTIGYSASVLVQMLLGLEIGLQRGFLTDRQYGAYVNEARRLPAGIEQIIQKSLAWMEGSKRTMLRSSVIIFTGAGSLYGVALEGSVKIWEIPQIPSMGYELEEGIHGPNYGYNHNHCVIVLNDGGRENDKAAALARYMKKEWRNGFMIGKNVVDGGDLAFEPQCGAFMTLEFAAAVQVIAYTLAYDSGRDLMAPHDNRVMYSYFISHSDYKTDEKKGRANAYEGILHK